MDLTLHFTYTPEDLDDFVRSNKVALKGFPVIKGQATPAVWSWSMIGWIMVLAMALAAFQIFHYESIPPAPGAAAPAPPPNPLLNIILNAVPYLVIVVIIWFFFVRGRRQSQGKARLKRSPDLAQPYTVHITDDALFIAGPTSETRYTWSHFLHFYETRSLFLLYNPSKAAHLFPKSAFPDAGATAAFREFLRSKISPAPAAFPITPLPHAQNPAQ